MNPEEKRLLQDTYDLAQENNKMLRKMVRIARLAQIARIFYWTIIIGGAVGAFYYLQPYLDRLLSIYSGISDTASQLQHLIKQ